MHIDYVSPSLPGSTKLRFRGVCDLAMIYNKAFFLETYYIYCKQINPHMNQCFAFENKFGEAFKFDATHQ